MDEEAARNVVAAVQRAVEHEVLRGRLAAARRGERGAGKPGLDVGAAVRVAKSWLAEEAPGGVVRGVWAVIALATAALVGWDKAHERARRGKRGARPY